MLWSPHKDCCWQTLHKWGTGRCHHKGPQSFPQLPSLVCRGVMKYLDVNGARFLAEKLASISSLQAGAPAVSRLPPWELPGSREGKVYSEAPSGTAGVIEARGNGCKHWQRGIMFAGAPRPLGIFSCLLLPANRFDKAPQANHRAAISRCQSF